jgi:hypothetical protein
MFVLVSAANIAVSVAPLPGSICTVGDCVIIETLAASEVFVKGVGDEIASIKNELACVNRTSAV